MDEEEKLPPIPTKVRFAARYLAHGLDKKFG